MRENCNDLCWVKYLPRVQFEKNTIHHSTIGITPYEALFHHKPSFGLSDLGIPSEIASDIHTEQDLECVIDEINAAAADDSEMMPDAPSDNEYPPHVTSQTFPIIDLLPHAGQTSYSSPPPDSYLEVFSIRFPLFAPVNHYFVRCVTRFLAWTSISFAMEASTKSTFHNA